MQVVDAPSIQMAGLAINISILSKTCQSVASRRRFTAIARWIDAEQSRLILLFILAHTLVWAVVPWIVRSPGALWDDMLETYAWSQQWQLGYYKHPPFYSWVVGVWFEIFPRSEWAYYLLSSVNVGVGFAGVSALAGRFLKIESQLLSIVLLTFMPYYNYMASNFNANTVLLSLWPWTVYCLVRSLEKRSLLSGISFGMFAAAAMLSKYYSVLLLASCFFASLAHPNMKQYYASPAPYVAIGVSLLLCSPHIWWAISNDFPPVKYALGKTGQAWSTNSYKAITTALASLAINGVAAIILVLALQWRRPALLSSLWRRLLVQERWWIMIIACGPFLITIFLGTAGYIKVALNFLIPAFFMLPMMILMALEPAITREAVKRVTCAAVFVLCAALLIAPGVAYATFYFQVKGTSEVSPIATREAARYWHDAFNLPVKIVSGSETYSLAQGFYGTDSPSEFTHFDFDQAPWISKERIKREGLLSICDANDKTCFSSAGQYANTATRKVQADVGMMSFGYAGPKRALVYILTPPVGFGDVRR